MRELPDIALYLRALEPRIVGHRVIGTRLVVYAANEASYCANCQTGGRLLADRSLSRLLRDDWPRTLEELERRRGRSG